MAMSAGSFSADARRSFPSPRPGRENQAMNNRACNNGPNCRKFQEGTCPYNHNVQFTNPNLTNANLTNVNLTNPSLPNGAAAKRLNVDSPAFTPLSPNVTPASQSLGISPKAATAAVFTPKAATAAVFTPKGSGTQTPSGGHSKDASMDWPQHGFQEFVPQSFAAPHVVDPLDAYEVETSPALTPQVNPYDYFVAQQSAQSLDGAHQQTLNPYAQQQNSTSTGVFNNVAADYKHPLNYHLYASIGPHREKLLSYQRITHDFFIPDDLREDLQRKSEATLQTFANTTLPQTLEYFHSLVALDTNTSKAQPTFGYPSWVYKAVSSKDGNTYTLRRLEGFRLMDERAVRPLQVWKRVSNSSVVVVHDAFTTRQFGDSSLIVVTDYFPLSQTLAEKHFVQNSRHPAARALPGAFIPENDLWGYIVQLASAVKVIHSNGLAAQTIIPSKIILTSKNRLRLNSCGVMDIARFAPESNNLSDLQQADLLDLGRLILCLATRNPNGHLNAAKSLELVSRSYSEKLRQTIAWLITPPPAPADGRLSEASQADLSQACVSDYNVEVLLTMISSQILQTFDSSLSEVDALAGSLAGELENGRLVRLLTKLNTVLERPESSPTGANPTPANLPSSAWSETGDRYYLKLFRDYVFHQVDHEGRPVLDLGHQLTCLNKLDVGIDEKVTLVSRDEQSCFVVTYREIKRAFEAAWSEVMKVSTPSRR